MIFDPDKEKEARENLAVQRGLEQARKGEFVKSPIDLNNIYIDGSHPTRRMNAEDRRQEARRVEDKELPTLSLDELRGLASTVRQCQRTGHPDLSKHLEALLIKLGA